jgi:fructan beta-fructosidase
MPNRILFSLLCILFHAVTASSQSKAQGDEAYRPQIHFTPAAHWMNDPNGMVYHKGIYHLFYQDNPNSSVWGPMHWGHATSTDLLHWKRQPISLYPDSIGTIFSGSAAVDEHNTSGLGKNGEPPLVAIYTQHNEQGEKAGRNDFQNQSIAYSLDNGLTWTKYKGNPVLKNPGIRDFRDPKVCWFPAQKKWIMTLAVTDHINFYSSPDLLHWTKESEFGAGEGAHGGVWECPDLFPMEYGGKTYWILIVNLNPGGPNKGSATQYFIGDFDGKRFSSHSSTTKWLDYGPDEYAGVTWSNTGSKRIFLGWMSNWMYANEVPTETWRSAMTIPRELGLTREGQELLLASKPIGLGRVEKLKDALHKSAMASGFALKITAPSIVSMTVPAEGFSLAFCNDTDTLKLGFDAGRREFFIDRSNAGIASFNREFAARAVAPRLGNGRTIDLTVVLDRSSVELFADHGLTSMTAICFPHKPYEHLLFSSPSGKTANAFSYRRLNGVWH